MNNQKETHSKSYLCYKNTEKYSCFLIFCVNFARDIHLLEVQQGKRVGVDFMEMGVYLAPVFDIS